MTITVQKVGNLVSIWIRSIDAVPIPSQMHDLCPICQKKGGNAFVKNSSFISHSSCSWENYRSKRTLLNFTNTSLIGTVLAQLMPSVNTLGIGGLVAWSLRIKNLYIVSQRPPQKTVNLCKFCFYFFLQ